METIDLDLPTATTDPETSTQVDGSETPCSAVAIYSLCIREKEGQIAQTGVSYQKQSSRFPLKVIRVYCRCTHQSLCEV